MKRDNWLKALGAGVAIACLMIPLAAQGATSSDQTQPSPQNRTLKNGSGTKLTASDQSAARKQRKALHARKAELIKERSELAKQGDKEALDKNSTQIDAIDSKLNSGRKGGAK
jgi:hypothetical protein